jgi:multidrug efflux pump subunit AcrA (membrane-fusion protein)
VKRLRSIVTFLLVVGILGGTAFWLYRTRQVQAKSDIPSAEARRGDFQVIVRCRGELVALRSVQLIAPFNVPGLQIVWQAPANSEIAQGDVAVRFDSSAARAQLREKEASLKQAEATLEQASRTGAHHGGAGSPGSQCGARGSGDAPSWRLRSRKSSASCRASKVASIWEWRKRNCAWRRAAVELHQKSDASKIASITRQRDKAQADIDITNKRLATWS